MTAFTLTRLTRTLELKIITARSISERIFLCFLAVFPLVFPEKNIFRLFIMTDFANEP